MNHLPLWHFFEQLETELSYERWLGKYKLFLQTLASGYLPFDDDWLHLRCFCKTLLLQNKADEPRFDQLFDAACEREHHVLEMLLLQGQTKSDTGTRTGLKLSDANEGTTGNGGTETEPTLPPIPPPPPKGLNEPPEDDDTEITKYYHPPAFNSDQNGQVVKKSLNFLHSDEYLPVSRRDMVKGWQFLRRKEIHGHQDKLDVAETVAQIARDGLFLEAVYEAGYRNRQDTVILFADYRGSMTPFHELTNRLIEAARGEGGHALAPVYYFQNYPLGYVYEQPNMSGPKKLKEALLKANRNFTLAIVISDAGAARGSSDPARIETREKMTQLFLKTLHESCAHVVWLNPMPVHRWRGTAAENISRNVFVMAPVMEETAYNFQDTLRVILKQNKPTIKI